MLNKLTSTAFIAAALCLPLAGCEMDTDENSTIPLEPGVENPDTTVPNDNTPATEPGTGAGGTTMDEQGTPAGSP